MDFTDLIDLAAERLGGAMLVANDEFFAPKENLLKTSAPIFVEDKYTDLGKWMDGWETRRKRTPGHDWCIVRLGLPGVIRGVVVDTSYFRGNYPEQCSLEACTVDGHPTVDQLTNEATSWTEILTRLPLEGDTQNPFTIKSEQRFTHLRFNIYPDGGVARLRVYGEVVPDWSNLKRPGREIDLAAVENGGLVLSCSDMFFGHRHNLIMPGRPVNMSDGWETRRRRGPGHDWVIVKLGTPGHIERLEVDTSHFKGNFPDSCSLEACNAVDASVESLTDLLASWKSVLPRTKLQAHTRHHFADEVLHVGRVSHVRFSIFPDGGVGRLRVYGSVGDKTPSRPESVTSATTPSTEEGATAPLDPSELERRR
jgi:allantoicase